MVIDDKMVNPVMNQTSVHLGNIANGQTADFDEVLKAKETGPSRLSEVEEKGLFKVEKVKLKPFEKVRKKVSIFKTSLKKTQKAFTRKKVQCRSLCALQITWGEKEQIDAFLHDWTDYTCLLLQPDEEMPTEYSMRKGNKRPIGHIAHMSNIGSYENMFRI
jgi:hypothetical protein